jgi:hypothetical protein
MSHKGIPVIPHPDLGREPQFGIVLILFVHVYYMLLSNWVDVSYIVFPKVKYNFYSDTCDLSTCLYFKYLQKHGRKKISQLNIFLKVFLYWISIRGYKYKCLYFMCVGLPLDYTHLKNKNHALVIFLFIPLPHKCICHRVVA